jgi:hypothetical protein
MKQVFEKIKYNMNYRPERAQATTKVTIELMEENLIQPTKVQTMIQEFMATLTRDMKNLIDNSTSHTTNLEELLYQIFISIESQYQVLEACVRDKDT